VIGLGEDSENFKTMGHAEVLEAYGRAFTRMLRVPQPDRAFYISQLSF